MIAKAPAAGKCGADTYGLLRYLFGKGKANEHTNPHLVAAWDPEWLDDGAFAALIGSRGWMPRLARDVDAVMNGHDVQVEGGHVYHVVLSVPQVDGQLGDATWRTLVDNAIEHMGLGPDAGGVGGCRWLAVHHGTSAEGNDHVHLVVNLVRGDGKIASTFRDWPRWRQWCLAVEERLDLSRTAPAGAGRRDISRTELERAAKAGTETDRVRLTRLVTEAAAAAHSEIDFLGYLQRKKVCHKVHLSGGKVVGYAVALPAEGVDSEPMWFAGSTLRRDLSLPRLRARWEEPGELWEDVASQWWTGEREADTGEPIQSHTAWRQVRRLLAEAETTMSDEIGDNRDRWSQAVGETADLVAVLARFDPAPDRLERVADHLARAAQLERGQRRPSPRQQDAVLPLLVRAARTVAACKSPEVLVLTAVVVLVWALMQVLLTIAERDRLGLRPSARQQLAAAATELSGHPLTTAVTPEVNTLPSTVRPPPSHGTVPHRQQDDPRHAARRVRAHVPAVDHRVSTGRRPLWHEGPSSPTNIAGR
jgi:hypothetical protein